MRRVFIIVPNVLPRVMQMENQREGECTSRPSSLMGRHSSGYIKLKPTLQEGVSRTMCQKKLTTWEECHLRK